MAGADFHRAFGLRTAVKMLTLALLFWGVTTAGTRAQSPADLDAAIRRHLEANPQTLKAIIRHTLMQNPEILQEAGQELQRRKTIADATARAAAIQTNTELLFRSLRDGVLGKADGPITVVEFVDYNCGFCKRALADAENLIAADQRIRIVLKEFPVLGLGSLDAARVGVAVRLADQSGSIYQRFHKALLLRTGQIGKAQALAVAADVGLDAAKIEAAMAGKDVADTLEQTKALAAQLSIRGTPAYVIGDTVVAGAVGLDALKARIAARSK